MSPSPGFAALDAREAGRSPEGTALHAASSRLQGQVGRLGAARRWPVGWCLSPGFAALVAREAAARAY
ncbi:hypothetical protein H5407_17825 [Mitsuaria sp. WAJ17]|uniref:hypothetical protein n=1 Tax=Mitsuaria sp. WAJ17 TaxID=2761452 RepID=UPI0015FFBFF4|nr:hypothetical protein [Mitsuaria sp. WAJ17]MBB2487093.1 hypothetical protein [Mitsuaria sp. WAJ17]